MKKNVASQTIGAQMITAADGSAFTGTVACAVTGDAGTQGAGGGSVTHEGNGYHSYAPTQAETNFDHVAFTFTGTGAIPATVQVYTEFPQTGDAFARLGAPAGASVSADVAAVKAETATILADTNDIQTRLPAALVSGRMDSSTGAMAANVLTAAATAADFTTEIQAGLATAAALATAQTDLDNIDAKTTNLPTDPADQSLIIAATNAIVALIGTPAVTLAADIAALPTTTDIAALPTAAENADAVWDEAIAGHLGAGSTGAALNAAGSAGDPWTTPLPGAYGAGTAGFIIGTNIDAPISTVDTVADAIKAKTDSLTFTKAGEVDSNIKSVNSVTIVGDGSGTPFNV